MEIAAFIVAVVAGGAAAASAVIALIARADSKKSGEAAARAAERATVATERLASIQGRIFDGPPWEVTYVSGDAFLLTNTSPLAAEQVVISTVPEDLQLSFDPLDQGIITVGARSAVKFVFSANLGMGFKRDIVVEWQREGDTVTRRWQHPIPPKPRR